MSINSKDIPGQAPVCDAYGRRLGNVLSVSDNGLQVLTLDGERLWFRLSDIFTLDDGRVTMVFGRESTTRYALNN